LGHNTDALGDFLPLSNESLDKSSFKSYWKIYEKVKFYYENPQILKKILNSTSNDFTEKIKNSAYADYNKKLTCDDLFGIYLSEISSHVNQTFYKSITILLKQYRDCMNLLGWELWELYKDLLEEKTELEYCEVKNAELLPEICNEFLNEFLPVKLPSFDKHIACVAICEFCDWIYKSKFTHIRLNPYTKEENNN
jgi:hypothetical protein